MYIYIYIYNYIYTLMLLGANYNDCRLNAYAIWFMAYWLPIDIALPCAGAAVGAEPGSRGAAVGASEGPAHEGEGMSIGYQ